MYSSPRTRTRALFPIFPLFLASRVCVERLRCERDTPPSTTRIRFGPLLFPRDFREAANRGQSRARAPPTTAIPSLRETGEIRNRSCACAAPRRVALLPPPPPHFLYRTSTDRPSRPDAPSRAASSRLVTDRAKSCLFASRRVASCRVALLRSTPPSRPTFPNLAPLSVAARFLSSRTRHQFFLTNDFQVCSGVSGLSCRLLNLSASVYERSYRLSFSLSLSIYLSVTLSFFLSFFLSCVETSEPP